MVHIRMNEARIFKIFLDVEVEGEKDKPTKTKMDEICYRKPFEKKRIEEKK